MADSSNDQYYRFIVGDDEGGVRIDKWLSSQPSLEMTRQRVQQLLADGHVMRNDVRVTSASSKIRATDSVQLYVPASVALDVVAEDIALDIRYEDDDVIVINKPAGMVVHPAAGVHSGTLVNALLHHCGDTLSGIGGVQRPGIVHRLDKETSGLIMVAKHDIAHQGLSAQLQDRSLSRTYHAICWGVIPASGTINAPIGRSPGNRKKMAVVDGGKAAITHYRRLKQLMTDETDRHPSVSYASLVEYTLESGRTHQIRVHGLHVNHPLLGDSAYGQPTSRRLQPLDTRLVEHKRDAITAFTRQALHAVSLRFVHPVTGVSCSVDAEYPDDMRVLLDVLTATH